jgi:crotonobetainyl-CoA:carnitine CoA-transferase CaiB-like acyl-CoA transferase
MKTDNTTTTDNIFSGLKVVDLSSFVAGPGAAVILSDFGADVIKVEPPKGELWRIGNKIPPQPLSNIPYMWHLNNRNKRGITLDLKSPDAVKVLERLAKWADVFIVNTPHPAREKLKLSYDDVAPWNPRLIYADITGYGDTGPDAALPGFDITAFWSRSGLLSLLHVTALYRRERTGKGSYVTTSLLAAGVWSAGVAIQAALAGAKFSPQHDRKNPANAAMNVYKSSDDVWFVLVVTPDKIPAIAAGIGRADLLKDPRFADPAKLAANMRQLTAIVDETFSSQPMAHWREVLDKAHIPYGLVRDPIDVIKDPQLQTNNIVVPLEGVGENMKLTVSSPIQVHGVAKVAAKRGPDLGEHNNEVLKELGFDTKEIEGLRSGGVIATAVENPKARAA